MSLIIWPTPVSPSREPSAHQSGSLTDNPRRLRQKEEDPHLHTFCGSSPRLNKCLVSSYPLKVKLTTWHTCKGNKLTTWHTCAMKASRVATVHDNYQRVEPGPLYPSVGIPCDTSMGICGWPPHYLTIHPLSIVGCHPTQRPLKLLSLQDLINLVCAST
jgi:hypothetical protein